MATYSTLYSILMLLLLVAATDISFGSVLPTERFPASTNSNNSMEAATPPTPSLPPPPSSSPRVVSSRDSIRLGISLKNRDSVVAAATTPLPYNAKQNPYHFKLDERKKSYGSADVLFSRTPLSERKHLLLDDDVFPPKAIVANTNNNGNNNNNHNGDKNWMLTKAWLIDNINRLRRELSELERDYSQHLDQNQRDQTFRERQLTEEMVKLRDDHSMLSRQQKQIMFLLKKNNLLKGKHFKMPIKVADAISSSMPRPIIKRDTESVAASDGKFETETRRNMKEVFAELSALHDITLLLFDDLRSLERRIEIRDKFSK